MFADVNQIEQALQATRPQQAPKDPGREVVEVAAAFMLGRSIGKLFSKQAAGAQNRCW